MEKTIRDYFAGKAMQGLIAENGGMDEAVEIARNAFALADAMLAVRNAFDVRPFIDELSNFEDSAEIAFEIGQIEHLEQKESYYINEAIENLDGLYDLANRMASSLAAITTQRDELLQTVKAVQTMCHGAIRVRIDGIIAKCEVQNDER